MARIFLSYARDDARFAERLANAIGSAGHDVWWDRHLHAGSRFAAEIDKSLRNAEAVVVLWSPRSIDSAWVQDEAVEARDSGRLIPVVLDGGQPPLGFRQFQSVDLDQWVRSGSTEAPEELVRAIGKTAGEVEREPAPERAQNAAARGMSSVCVLPFANMSGDPEQDYFSDGITEEVITDLSKVSALSVVSRHTAFTFKGTGADVQSVARKLDVDHVLEGSVRKSGSRLRITVQLTDGSSGKHIWAERYDRDLTDVFEIQDEISKAIVTALKVKLLPKERAALEDRGTSSVDAYDLYLMARQYWISGNDGDPRRDEIILRLCRNAVEIDPAYARAWALIALTQSLMNFRNQDLEDGVEAAQTALELDPKLAEPHCVKAAALARQGKYEEANKEIAIAVELDPDSWEVNQEAGYVLYTQGKFAEALPYYEKASAAAMETDYRSAGFLMGLYKSLGEPAKARAAAITALERAERAVAQDKANAAALAWGANVLAYLGERERAQEWGRRALIVDPGNLIVRYNLACAFASDLQDIDSALDLLEDWFVAATPSELRHAATDPDFDAVRQHERFRQMMDAAAVRVGEPGLRKPD